MKTDTVVTLDDNIKYYLSDETVYEDNKYFLATRLDEEDDMTEDSYIFKEFKEGDRFRLEQVVDEKTYNYIAAVFTTNFISLVEEDSEGA